MNDIVFTMLARLALVVVYQGRRIEELEAANDGNNTDLA